MIKKNKKILKLILFLIMFNTYLHANKTDTNIKKETTALGATATVIFGAMDCLVYAFFFMIPLFHNVSK